MATNLNFSKFTKHIRTSAAHTRLIMHRGFQGIQRQALALRRLLTAIYNWLGRVAVNLLHLLKKKLSAIRAFIARSWLLFTRRVMSRMLFCFVSALLIALLLLVFRGVVTFYVSKPSAALREAGARVLEAASFKIILNTFLCALCLWLLLRLLAKHTLVVLNSLRGWSATLISYAIRLVAALPTLILGYAILQLSDAAGIRPHSYLEVSLFIVSALTIIGLPTVLNIAQAVLKDQDRRQFYAARSLGVDKVMVSRQVTLRSIRRSFNMAVTVALGRVIIEGYIVLDNTLFKVNTVSATVKDSQDFLSVFYAVYSSMTIESNAVLITIFFLLAMLSNLWSFSAPVQRV